MSRYESPGQVALLLAGATLASLLLIVLFTADAKSRRTSRELDIGGGGVVSSLRSQVTRLAAAGLQGDGDQGRRAKRSLGGAGHHPGLEEVSRDDAEEGGPAEEDPPRPASSTPRPRHALRHRHHSRHRAQQRTTPRPRQLDAPVEGDAPAAGGEGEQRATVATPTDASDVSLSPRDGHAACYGPDQVVLIIALTCALNFACIFLVMALVHICNRNRKCASSGCDSPLLLVDSDYEDVDAKECPGEEDDDEEVDALLLSKRPSLFAPFLPHRPAPFPPPWRPAHSFLTASTAAPGGERRRGGPLLPTSSSSGAVGSGATASTASASRPLLPPAAFSMEDLHILE